MTMQQTALDVGIVAYGCALPRQKIATALIAQGRGKALDGQRSLGVSSKTVPQLDEDSITLATAAAEQAIQRFEQAAGHRAQIHTLFMGSESHPYAVKPSGSVIQTALGLSEQMALADLQFACKAGTQALQIVSQYAATQPQAVGLAIGADTAQAQPGDALEFTAAAGAAAFLIASEMPTMQAKSKRQKIHPPNFSSPHLLARLCGFTSVASDTPDFWRKPTEVYPQHAGRFTGGPAYFKHVIAATQLLLEEQQLSPQAIDFCVFHTPNAKFPQQVASELGFQPAQLAPALIVQEIGNTYAAASLLALVSVLDQAQAGQKILLTSYGSGAGADCFLFETTPALVQQRARWTALVREQIEQLQDLDFIQFQQLMEKRQSRV